LKLSLEPKKKEERKKKKRKPIDIQLYVENSLPLIPTYHHNHTFLPSFDEKKMSFQRTKFNF